MARDFKVRKRIILIPVVLLVLADLGLAEYSWQLAAAPRRSEKQILLETKQLNLLKGDIKHGQDIRDNVPATQKDCEQFEKSLFPASSGYSAVRSELGGTAQKSGVQIDALSFKQTEISNRGMTEVAIDATVNGNYKSVIGFLNGLQRSANVYSVESLTLGSDSNQASANVIRVALHLKTYFRTAA